MLTQNSNMKHIIIYILFAISATLVLLNRYTPLYINNSLLHYCLLFIAAATFIITVGHLFDKLRTGKSILATFILVAVICFIKAFLTWGGDWKTQTILYTSTENDNRAIEYQMRANRFTFGYRKRIINRLKIVPLIDWTTDIDTVGLKSTQWKRVSKNVNELNLEVPM